MFVTYDFWNFVYRGFILFLIEDAEYFPEKFFWILQYIVFRLRIFLCKIQMFLSYSYFLFLIGAVCLVPKSSLTLVIL